MAQILKRSNDFIFANISLLLFKDWVCLKYGSFVPIFFCMSGLQEFSQTALQVFYCSVFYVDAGLMLLAVCSYESICECATGCGQYDCGDAQEEMHSSPPQRPAMMCKRCERGLRLAQVSWPEDSSVPVSSSLTHPLLDWQQLLPWPI